RIQGNNVWNTKNVRASAEAIAILVKKRGVLTSNPQKHTKPHPKQVFSVINERDWFYHSVLKDTIVSCSSFSSITPKLRHTSFPCLYRINSGILSMCILSERALFSSTSISRSSTFCSFSSTTL